MSEHEHQPSARNFHERSGKPLVEIGDIVNAEHDEYHRGAHPHLQPGDGDLHLRVKYLPKDASVWGGEWLSLRGVEMPPGEPEKPEMPFVVRRRALPGHVPDWLPAAPGTIGRDGHA
ncbi:hypothetical protein AB0J90_11105 [Micromonospora sp. NPDC049523]|uniref:hypothetical protein n=1 Tax=Micromonospora sp. NPDC049523 TaxID=3155921 RepID=UPI00343EBDE9